MADQKKNVVWEFFFGGGGGVGNVLLPQTG